MKLSAYINEVFSSAQGEGLYVGEKMTFIRFASCSLNCRWCDTETATAEFCAVYHPSTNEVMEYVPNPVFATKLVDLLTLFSDPTISITGGEPLEQSYFLKEVLPSLRQTKRILLETNGILCNELKDVIADCDVVSMDLKLPSSTGMRPFWNEHHKFIEAVLQAGKELYIKLVLTSTTTDKDINEAIKLVTNTNRYVPVILQPVTSTNDFHDTLTETNIKSFERLFSAWLPNVKVIPQMHKEWAIK